MTQLENDVNFWKDAYHSLQTEYQNQVKDSTKRIDEKFDRLMFYFEETRKSQPQALNITSGSNTIDEVDHALDEEILRLLQQRKRYKEKDRKRFVVQMFRM